MQNYDGKFKLNGQEYFYRAKDDSGSSKIARVNNEEHHYRMVEITNKETGNYDVMMISTGDSFTMFNHSPIAYPQHKRTIGKARHFIKLTCPTMLLRTVPLQSPIFPFQ